MLGMYFIALTALGLFLLWRKRLFDMEYTVSKLFMKVAVLSIPLPFLANEVGWIAAEVGRQPWVVYGELRTADAVSGSVVGGQVLASIIMFSLIYSLLFGLWIYLLRKQFEKGPDAIESLEEGTVA